MSIHEIFRRFSQATADLMGSPIAFIASLAITLGWGLSGPYFHYSDSWQLMINTGTTIVTFLMVFLIQNTQSRDTRVIQLKLDELLRAHRGARNELVQMEQLSDEELDRLHSEFSNICQSAQDKLKAIENSRAARHKR